MISQAVAAAPALAAVRLGLINALLVAARRQASRQASRQ
jgi:hypothetical protein